MTMTHDDCHYYPLAQRAGWIPLAAFLVVPALIGMIPGALSFALNDSVVSDIGLDVLPVPGWFFTGLWVVIYGSMGMSVRTLFRQATGNLCVPVAILAAGFLQSHLFWLTDSLRTTAITDATGMLLAGTAFWVMRQYSTQAARWLLPWVIWMPVTLAIKIAALSGAFG